MNLFELFVKIGVDDQASKNISNIAGKLGNGLKTAAKVGTAAVGAAAAGITALTKAAVNNYAEYEQLVGGVETLFKDSANTLMSYASEAYKAQGISANEYMSLATSFSASLLQSLEGDTQKAVEATNLAITDMSDNANKMGTSMELIQNAYNGFAKENYTMLDNLKLGYGGTKEEMARLIADAAALSDTVDAQSMSFDNIVEAIHVVQTEMGITGTTAKEASTTISGSVGTMKAAWADFLTSLADENADYQWQLDNLLESVKTVAVNVFPVVEQVFWSISDMVEDVFPEIASKIPQIISEVLPRITEIAVKLVESLVGGISENQEMLMTTAFEIITYLANSFITMLPQIVQLGLDLIISLANGIVESLPELIPTIVDVVLQIVDILTNPDTLNSLIGAALEIMLALADGIINSIPVLVGAIPQLITSLIDGLLSSIPQIIQAGISLLTALVAALPDIITAIVEAIPEIIDGIITALTENIPLIIQAGIDLLVALIDALPEIISAIVQAIPQIISGIVDALIGNIDEIIMAGVELFVALIENLPTIIVEIVKAVPQIIEGIVEAFSSLGGELVDAGSDLLHGLWDGISGAASWLWEQVSGWASSLVSDIKNLFGIHSPSTVFASIGGYMAEGLGEGWDDKINDVRDEINDSLDFDDPSISINASVNKIGSEASGISGMSYGQNSIGNSTINIVINGAQYSDEDALAEAISYKLQEMMERRARA